MAAFMPSRLFLRVGILTQLFQGAQNLLFFRMLCRKGTAGQIGQGICPALGGKGMGGNLFQGPLNPPHRLAVQVGEILTAAR